MTTFTKFFFRKLYLSGAYEQFFFRRLTPSSPNLFHINKASLFAPVIYVIRISYITLLMMGSREPISFVDKMFTRKLKGQCMQRVMIAAEESAPRKSPNTSQCWKKKSITNTISKLITEIPTFEETI